MYQVWHRELPFQTFHLILPTPISLNWLFIIVLWLLLNLPSILHFNTSNLSQRFLLDFEHKFMPSQQYCLPPYCTVVPQYCLPLCSVCLSLSAPSSIFSDLYSPHSTWTILRLAQCVCKYLCLYNKHKLPIKKSKPPLNYKSSTWKGKAIQHNKTSSPVPWVMLSCWTGHRE